MKKRWTKAKIAAIIALFWIIISIIWTSFLFIYEVYFSKNNIETSSEEWSDFLNSLTDEQREEFLNNMENPSEDLEEDFSFDNIQEDENEKAWEIIE